MVSRATQGGQDQALWRLQRVLERVQGGNENGGPLSLRATGAAVPVSGGQTREAGDSVEVGVVGAEPGEGAEGGERRKHRKPEKDRRAEDQKRFLYEIGLV